jgi:nucleotide-binding universal stress UspA family protein
VSETAIAKPRRILLATDMTSRCDRALDRATQLAGAWGAELVVAYIVNPGHRSRYYHDQPRRWERSIPDPHDRMRWRLQRDIAGTVDALRVILEEGEPAERLVEIAAREECDLIVTGTARRESFERMILGSTITRLVRGSPTPVLMVHDRGMRPYRQIAIVTDFSEAAFQALLTTASFFPDSKLTLFHAYDIPFAGYATDRTFVRELEAMEKEVTARVLDDDRIDPALRRRISVEIEHGLPEALLDDFVEDQHMDLTVIGSHGRGAVFDTLIGSTAKRLVETLRGDLLIVRHRGTDG